MSTLIVQKEAANGSIRVLQGDLTLAETEAIVNAANSHLAHGGGVAAAIVRRGGQIIQDESDTIGFVPEGEAAVTSAGTLAARYVIHAVGPKGDDPQGDAKLQRAVQSSLKQAAQLKLTSISFPAISSGIFGFPVDRCAQILLSTAHKYLQDNPDGTIRHIDFVLFDEPTAQLFADTLRDLEKQ